MTTLTMRSFKGDFVVTGPDIEPMLSPRFGECNVYLNYTTR